MDKLVPYFEREMGILRHHMDDLVRRDPATAARIGLAGELGADPGHERIMQGTALLSAQISRKLDYYHTRLTNDLLAVLGPYYLSPVPSCSVVQVDPAEKRGIPTIPRGTELSTMTGPTCRFRTVYDVDSPAVTLVASYTAHIEAPLSLGLPANAGGAIRITIDSADQGISLAEAVAGSVRVCIDTDAVTRAALYDTLFARTVCACVEAEQQWHKLPDVPLASVGFHDREALLPTPQRQDDSLRLLTEYFACPEKFEFFDIDLNPVLAKCRPNVRRVVLHLLTQDLHQTSTPRLLRSLPATALRLGCTPIINMFTRMADPIRVQAGHIAYRISLPPMKDAPCIIYGVDGMKLLRTGQEGGAAIDMASSLRRSSALEKHCWLFKLADPTAGTEAEVSFVDDRHRPLELLEGTVKAQLTCTNGELPSKLPAGAAGGDLRGDKLAAGYRIRLLDTPTRPLVLADQPDSHFDVIAVISANHRSVAQWDLSVLQELLRMHARPECAITERQIAGIVGLERRETNEWLPNDYGASLAYGYQICLTIDEAAFTHRSIHAFAEVMDRVFGYYTPRGNFTRLIVQAQDGRKLVRCDQRPGGQSPA